MGFVAGGTAAEYVITNDGWWPDIDAVDVRKSLRMDGSITDVRLEVAIVNAMLSVNRELQQPKDAYLLEGAASLVQVPGPKINGESVLVAIYRRAILCTVGAELAERYRSYDSTNSGHQEADQLTPSIDEYRRDARWAIRDFLGVAHTTVELI